MSTHTGAVGKRRFSASLIVLLTLAAGVHLFCWSPYAVDVDPSNFRQALFDYDISRDRPHPPGYPLYVGMGRAAAVLVGEAYAYQVVNLALLLCTTVLVYRVTRSFAGRGPGLLAAALTCVHPVLLAATIPAECYITDALLAMTLAWLFTLRKTASPAWLFAALLLVTAALSMTRITSAVLLLPIAVWTLTTSRAARPIDTALGFAALAVGVIAAGYTTTIILAGGAETYRQATARVMGAAFRSSSVFGGAELATHLRMAARLSVWLMLIGLPVAFALLGRGLSNRRLPRPSLDLLRSDFAVATILIAGPFLAMYSLIYFLKPTYLTVIVCFANIAVAVALAPWIEKLRADLPTGRLAVTAAAVIAAAFLAIPGDRLPDPLYRLTARYFHDRHDAMHDLDRLLDEADQPRRLLVIRQLPEDVNLYQALTVTDHSALAKQLPDGIYIFDGQWHGPIEPGQVGQDSSFYRSIAYLDGNTINYR